MISNKNIVFQKGFPLKVFNGFPSLGDVYSQMLGVSPNVVKKPDPVIIPSSLFTLGLPLGVHLNVRYGFSRVLGCFYARVSPNVYSRE